MERDFDVTVLVNEVIRDAKEHSGDLSPTNVAVSHLMHFLVGIGRTSEAFEAALSLGGEHSPLDQIALLALTEALADFGDVESARQAADLFRRRNETSQIASSYACYGYVIIAKETEDVRDIEQARLLVMQIDDVCDRAEGLIDMSAIDYRESDIRTARNLINTLMDTGDSAALDRLRDLVRITWNEQDFINACKFCQDLLRSPVLDQIEPPAVRERFRRHCIDSVLALFEECGDADLMQIVANHIIDPALARAISASIQVNTRLSGNSPDAN
jgi:hypothetical protein